MSWHGKWRTFIRISAIFSWRRSHQPWLEWILIQAESFPIFAVKLLNFRWKGNRKKIKWKNKNEIRTEGNECIPDDGLDTSVFDINIYKWHPFQSTLSNRHKETLIFRAHTKRIPAELFMMKLNHMLAFNYNMANHIRNEKKTQIHSKNHGHKSICANRNRWFRLCIECNSFHLNLPTNHKHMDMIDSCTSMVVSASAQCCVFIVPITATTRTHTCFHE